MILNVITADGKIEAMNPVKALLEVTNQPSLTDWRNEANTLMKKNGTKECLPLVLIKALISGDWCNDYAD